MNPYSNPSHLPNIKVREMPHWGENLHTSIFVSGKNSIILTGSSTTLY
jgi:hypothetical protein